MAKSINSKRKQNDIDEEPLIKRKRIIADSDEETSECRCRKGCSKRSCPCFKSNSGCHSSCKCKTSCANLFNHLDYIFGENNQCSPHPCFADWLVKKIKTSDQLLRIDRENLRKQIEKCERLALFREKNVFQ